MMRLLITAASSIGLILFVAFVASRLARTRSQGMSIRMQVFLALAGIVGAFAFGVGVLVLDRIEARATLLAEGTARDEAAAMAALVGGEMDALSVGLEDVGRKLAAAGTGSPQLRDCAPLPQGGGDCGALSLALLDHEGRLVFASGLSPGEPGTVQVTSPIVVHGRELGSVRVVKPTIVVRRLLADFAPTILLISIVLGAAAAAAADFIGRAIARPIVALTAYAVRVSEGDRRAVPPPAHGREVQRLSFAFDSMRRELEGRPFVEAFAADLSHELKNPVAAIRASAEVLADGALEEPVAAAQFVARIQEATSRIEGLLEGLLSLARIEARGVEGAGVVDLEAVVRASVARVRERGSPVAMRAEPGAAVRGDALWLTRAVDNLLDNAAIHGDAQTGIDVELGRARDEVTLTVKNRGAIGRHVEKRLFRRFVTTRADRGGTGLGLAIVRAVAEAHRGSAECVAAGPPDVAFRVTLPAA